jgi:hypothetical protein
VALALAVIPTRAEEIRLQNAALAVTCDPSRMELTLTPTGQPALQFSSDWPKPGQVSELKHAANRASWRIADRHLTVSLLLTNASVYVEFTADEPGVLEWPALAPGNTARAWILPMFEGVYVPTDDARWQSFLEKESPMNTTSGLGLPFWGLDCGGFTLTCLLLNPFNNAIHFDTQNTRLRLQCSHEFTPNNAVKRFGVLLTVGAASPIEPARQYRRWLESRGEFVSLTEKIKRTPEAEKLLGAAHVYLWGDALLSVDDVNDWKGLVRLLMRESQSTNASPGRHLWSLLDSDARKAVSEIARAEWPDRYTKGVVAEALNRALTLTNLYNADAWRGVKMNTATAALILRDAPELTEVELSQRNTALFAAAFDEFLKPVELWGEGISPQMIRELSGAGLDRLWLGAEGWAGFVRRPETVTLAREKGFLIGPYDSYHSIHSPKAKPDDTWPTAQFDEELFRTGAIINANGKPRTGFKQRGFLLSPKAARPWVERRVAGLMKIFPANSWFVDCDGFGEFFDDYSPAHPATQASDLAERMARCAWIRDTYGAVIGSEGCSAGAGATLHFAHGVLTPVIGWGDPDLTDKQSKFHLGAYYPPNSPAVFFKPVPLKEDHRRSYFDPRFRLPLFQTIFHDSVVATHHWSNPSLKFPEVAGTVELLELLYNVPPLYHLNRQEFAKQKAEIKRHYDFFSPLHRELGLLPLTDFRWLADDKLVQQTVFGDRVEITANFSERDFKIGEYNLPAHHVIATWRNGSKRLSYQARGFDR